MTQEPTSGGESATRSNPQPVTVVGYPDHTPVPSGQSMPGLAGVKMAITSLRAIVVVTLVLVLILTAGLVAGIVVLRGQVSALSDQVAALSAQRSAPATPSQQPAQSDPPEQPEQAEQAEQANDAAAAPQSQVPQLPSAPELPSGIPVPGGVDGSGAILVGNPDASNVVEVYLDYQCPFCQRWEAQIGEALNQRALQPNSDVLVKHYVLAFLGETSPTLDPPGASARAASAAVCVAEGEGPEAFAQFSKRVYALADPNEPAGQFTTDVLADVAAELGASGDTLECIEQERHVTFVALGTQAGFGRGVQGTPTVVVNGRTVENSFDDAELISLAG